MKYLTFVTVFSRLPFTAAYGERKQIRRAVEVMTETEWRETGVVHAEVNGSLHGTSLYDDLTALIDRGSSEGYFYHL